MAYYNKDTKQYNILSSTNINFELIHINTIIEMVCINNDCVSQTEHMFNNIR